MASELDDDAWKLYKWNIDNAHIKDNDVDKHDIGILELENKYGHKFFEPTALLSLIQQQQAKIIPICLGALNLNTKINSSTEINQLGWGRIYEESPLLYTRDPIYSSCMTSKASPLPWRFQNCDMERLKVWRPNKKWECEKTQPPPDYEKDQLERCQKYFKLAEKVEDNLVVGKTLSETILKKVDHIGVNKGSNDRNVFTKQEICYNPKLLSTFGWCYLRDFKGKKHWKGRDAWGICSPSCESMQVSNSNI